LIAVAKNISERTLADLHKRFGAIPARRIRTVPAPGMATETDVLEIYHREKRPCELIDGVLLEKTVGYSESLLAGFILTVLNNFVLPRRLGLVAGEGGMQRFAPGLVYIPDVSYVSRPRLPGGRIPEDPIPDLVPDLAVEVLSKSNTRREMAEKLKDYFATGVRLVWYVDPRDRTVAVYTAPRKPTILTEKNTLTGGDVLPGFKLQLKKLFAVLDE